MQPPRQILTMGSLGCGLFVFLSVAAVSNAQLVQPKPGAAQEQPPAGTAADGAPLAPDGSKVNGRDYAVSDSVRRAMSITKELLKPDEKQANLDFRKMQFDYRKAMGKGKLDRISQEVVRKGLRYRIHTLSMKSQHSKLHKARTLLTREIRGAADFQTNQTARRQFREFVCKEVVDRSLELLDNNFHVRLNAVIIISELNLSEGDLSKGISPVAYTPAAVPLMQILTDHQQSQAVRVFAIKGLRHVLLFGEPKTVMKFDIAKKLMAELSASDTHFWYQLRLIEALGSVDLTVDAQGDPFIVQRLMETLADRENRIWIVRAEAAKQLGRIPLAPGVKVENIVFEITSLAADIAQAYNPNQKKWYWKECCWDVYLAYQPSNSREKQILDNPGLLTKKGGLASVKAGYVQILPLVQHVMRQPREDKDKDGKIIRTFQPLSDRVRDAITAWVKNNTPAKFIVKDGMPSYRRASKQTAAPADVVQPVSTRIQNRPAAGSQRSTTLSVPSRP